MNWNQSLRTLSTRLRTAAAGVVLAVAALAPASVMAQTATIYGSLGNFDVINHTGHDGHGFEIELEGLNAGDVYYTYTYQRYGAPKVVPYETGVRLRWESLYDNSIHRFTSTTVPHAAGTAFAGTCYMSSVNYASSGCEHFGVSLRANALKTTYRWLIEDPQAPGTLIPSDPPSPIAAPVYYVAPPARPAEPPQLVIEVEAPEPAEAPELYGDAQWMRVFVTQLQREVTLDELLTGNPIVPMNAAQIEGSEWQIIQQEPASGGSGNRKRKRNQGNLDPTTRSVVRRIELYSFSGSYDPATHEALCADLTCTAPAAGELGEMISAQMTAANVQPDSLTITKAGNGSGSVDSTDKILSCGNKCVSPYSAGGVVTLTVKPASDSVFSGWTGACTGTDTTCTVTINGHVDVSATFTSTRTGTGGGGGGTTGGGGSTPSKVTLTTKVTGGKGAIASAPAGIDCGRTCSASFTSGTAVRLTATPEAGFVFVNWTGACTGTSPACDLTVTAATSVQANFKK